ncbi:MULTISPECIES: FadR/GntR family transcriptional regulator [unclassified Luteococcus]|uniref:FadR/GntR family transcriptional regulator n=1 Tax=unclassified Luteococcus TaxID=2639923 RepID=UPI00313B1722
MGTSRRTLAADSVRERIKAYIVEHQLLPGALMPTELVLCEELGVSRSSLREAIRQLDALDIVDVQHGRGTFVGNISLAPLVNSVTFRCTIDPRGPAKVLREIVDVRRALDAGQAQAVVSTMQGSHDEQLHALADAMTAKAEADEDFTTEDRAFHTLLMGKATGNTLAQNLIGAFWDIHTVMVKQGNVHRHEDIIDTAKAHTAMLEAAEAGDLAGYLAAVDAHYRPLSQVIERLDGPTQSAESTPRG